MSQLKNVDENNTIINKNMVVSIINLATKEIEGVVDLYRSTRLWFLKFFDKNVGKGVRVRYTQLGMIIDVYVIVSTVVEINDVVYRVQQNIKNSLTALLPLKISAINVHIKDAKRTKKVKE